EREVVPLFGRQHRAARGVALGEHREMHRFQHDAAADPWFRRDRPFHSRVAGDSRLDLQPGHRGYGRLLEFCQWYVGSGFSRTKSCPDGICFHPMNRVACACAAVLTVTAFALSGAAQSVYPTGTTIYDPAKAWNGFTVLSPLGGEAVLVIDMNGTVVKRWEGF